MISGRDKHCEEKRMMGKGDLFELRDLKIKGEGVGKGQEVQRYQG